MDSVSPHSESCAIFLLCLVYFHSHNYHMSRLFLYLLIIGCCGWRRWCWFPLLCLLHLGQGVQIHYQLRWTISLCALGLRSVAYNWGTLLFCCREQVEQVQNISVVKFACEFAVWFGLCCFLICCFFVVALFAQTMVASLRYGFLNWLDVWGLVCQWWLWWWLWGVSLPLELASCWAPLELGAHCWILCWVTVFSLVVWTFCQRQLFLGGTCCSVDGILFSILSILCSASYSIIPSLFLFCFRAFVKSFRAFTIISSDVKAGCVVYLCLKYPVSDILSLLVFLTSITWHC